MQKIEDIFIALRGRGELKKIIHLEDFKYFFSSAIILMGIL
jgi:hypothetical protein